MTPGSPQVDDLYQLGSVEGVARNAGFATLVVELLKADDLAVELDRADAALYRAKSAGKGQVHLAA